MKSRRLTWIVLVMVLAMVLAACGGDGDDNGDGGEEINLSQSVTASMEGAGEYTLHYPEGWVGIADGETIMVANSQATLDKMNAGGDTKPDSGEVGVTAMALPAEFLFMFGVEEGGSITDVVNGFAANITDEESTSADFGDPETFEANGKNGALLAGTVTEGDNTYGAIMAAVEVEGGIGIVMVVTHEDEVDDYKDTAKAMAGEFEFTPEATE
jgi:hypothetical protein